MSKFERLDETTAPAASLPLIEKSKAAFGRLPGLHSVMAGAPALLDGYQVLHRLFAEETAFDAEEKPWSGKRLTSRMNAITAYPPILASRRQCR